jgi:phosphoribosylformylglycinamidine cyclo-ligase
MQEIGNVADAEMHRTFNMGVGMVVICAPADADTIRYHFDSPGSDCFTIGRVVEGNREVRMV